MNVLGALIEMVEALASQRLALAPFTKVGARPVEAPAGTTGAAAAAASGAGNDGDGPAGIGAGESGADAGGGDGTGLLRISGTCFNVWAAPLHPRWLEVGQQLWWLWGWRRGRRARGTKQLPLLRLSIATIYPQYCVHSIRVI